MSFKIFFHLAPTIELVGSCQVAALHLSEYGTSVDQMAFGEIEINACTQKLFSQQGNIKIIRVETCKVTTRKLVS